jgi:uncharacterized phiE125 gp8 family phage protein
VAYSLRVVTPPVEEPVSLTEAKLWLKQDVGEDDALITALIKAARGRAELETGRAFVTRTLELTLDAFPPADGAILLPHPPLASVVSLSYAEPVAGASTAFADYQTLAVGDFTGLVPTYTATWPTFRDQWGAVVIRYMAGYGAASVVPEELKAAMKLMIAAWYEGRSEAEMPPAACALLRGYWTGQYLPGLELTEAVW